MLRNLRIALWNANGLETRRNELLIFSNMHDLDVILVTESHLQPNKTFSLPDYQMYRTDRPAHGGGNPWGGTAVFVHRRQAHRHVTVRTTFEATGVAVHAGGVEIIIFSAYVSPGANFRTQELDILLDQGGVSVVGGDFNAKHHSWNSTSTNMRGRMVREHLDLRGDVDVAAPIDPTHYPARIAAQPDILDVFMLKGVTFQTTVYTVDDLSSDHVPVFLEMEVVPTAKMPPRNSLRTDWAQYGQLVERGLVAVVPLEPAADTEALNSQISDLTETLAGALAAASRPSPPRAGRPPLPAHLRLEVIKRRRLRKMWQRTRHPLTRAAFNRQCRNVKELLYAYRAESWDKYLSSLELEDGSAWKTAKKLRNEKHTNQPIHGQQGLTYSTQEKAEVFADTMEEQFRPHAGIYDEDHIYHVEHTVNEFFSRDPDDELPPFTAEEVEAAVRKSKPRKAPGLDEIGARALLAAPYVLILYLVSVFNSILRLQHFPDDWKVAKVVLFPKPGKSRLFPQNYRPISLLPTISKLFERLLLSRLQPYLDGFIRPEQFGFRRGHSTTQQLVRVVNDLIDNTNLNLCSVAVFLDVSKAFDKVWHEGLLYKLIESPLPRCSVHLLRSYLDGRTFRIGLDGVLSTERPIEAGVPQGSVLAPPLYLIFTNDIPTIAGVTLSLYADDAMFLTRSARPQLARDRLERQMNELSPWLRKWRISVNAEKSNAVCFKKRRRMPRARPPPIELDGEPIEWKTQAKYLGVTLDSKLNFAAHAKKKLSEAKAIQGHMAPLIGWRSTLPVKAKLTMFLLVVRSVIMYASTAWWAICAPTHKKRLQVIQNKALRSISRQPWFVRNERIRRQFYVPTLDMFAKSTAQKLFLTAAESTMPHIRAIAERPDNLPDYYRPRPMAVLDLPP